MQADTAAYLREVEAPRRALPVIGVRADHYRAAPLSDELPGWRDSAACGTTDPEAFFPEKGGSTRDAKKVCRSCFVKADCLEFLRGHCWFVHDVALFTLLMPVDLPQEIGDVGEFVGGEMRPTFMRDKHPLVIS